MAASLSAYWVKFFKGAGFPQDVATKHAVVFSNNRIKPDMLPDLDKPSLKEMGITLMGDMIAILRYAKKVVEETTCERFLVDSEDTIGTMKLVAKPVVKKTVAKVTNKTVVSKSTKPDSAASKKVLKVPSTAVAKIVSIKKPMSTSSVAVAAMPLQKKELVVKRKMEDDDDKYNSGNEEHWNGSAKKLKPVEDKDKVYTVMLPKGPMLWSQQTAKKSVDQKRTVFDRLGDSSVTSTTNLAEALPTFNITGLGKDVLKRSASVFNRLGDKDAKDNSPPTGILKNGTNSASSAGILKNRVPSTRNSIATAKKVGSKSIGTMRADQEINKKVVSSAKQLVKGTKKISSNDKLLSKATMVKWGTSSGKLASERLTSIPAKARLGMSKANGAKQVTFDRLATVTHVKKQNVFSRLGI